ncbi:MAG: hypothetical protein CMI65_12905 [Pedosphaera sp.]|nr:hypothetical protein [Pedosphaera sp.]
MEGFQQGIGLGLSPSTGGLPAHLSFVINQHHNDFLFPLYTQLFLEGFLVQVKGDGAGSTHWVLNARTHATINKPPHEGIHSGDGGQFHELQVFSFGYHCVQFGEPGIHIVLLLSDKSDQANVVGLGSESLRKRDHRSMKIFSLDIGKGSMVLSGHQTLQ